jgi:tetratricopeptide (TPR) repeat protein
VAKRKRGVWGYLTRLGNRILPPVRRLSLPTVRPVQAEHGSDSIEAAKALDEAGHGFVKHGQWRKAETVWRAGLAIKEAQRHPDHPDVALTLARIANVARDPEDAESDYRRSIATYETKAGPDLTGLAYALNGFGNFLVEHSRVEEAEVFLRRSVVTYERALGRSDRQLVDPLIDLASVLVKLSREEEAERLLRRAKIIYELAEGKGPYNRALSLLINLLDRQSRHDEARQLAEGLHHDDLDEIRGRWSPPRA